MKPNSSHVMTYLFLQVLGWSLILCGWRTQQVYYRSYSGEVMHADTDRERDELAAFNYINILRTTGGGSVWWFYVMWGFVFEGSWGLRSADSIAALGSHGCQVSNLISIDLRFPWKLGTTRFLRDAINSCFSKLLSSFGEACYWTIYRWLPVSVFERLRFFGALFGFYWDVGDTICCIVYVRYVLRHDSWFRLVMCCS